MSATGTPYGSTAFPMIEVPRIPPKPRRHSMLLMSEVGIPLRVSEDLIEIAEPLIDYAKKSIFPVSLRLVWLQWMLSVAAYIARPAIAR